MKRPRLIKAIMVFSTANTSSMTKTDSSIMTNILNEPLTVDSKLKEIKKNHKVYKKDEGRA